MTSHREQPYGLGYDAELPPSYRLDARLATCSLGSVRENGKTEVPLELRAGLVVNELSEEDSEDVEPHFHVRALYPSLVPCPCRRRHGPKTDHDGDLDHNPGNRVSHHSP